MIPFGLYCLYRQLKKRKKKRESLCEWKLKSLKISKHKKEEEGGKDMEKKKRKRKTTYVGAKGTKKKEKTRKKKRKQILRHVILKSITGNKQ